MKKLLVLLFILLINTQAQNKYFVVFCAKEGFLGHAFVGFGKEDSSLKSSTYEAWGLYPKDMLSALSAGASFSGVTINATKEGTIIGNDYLGPFPGKLKNDFLTKTDNKLIVQVSQNQFQKALKVKENWKNRGYQLGMSDCVNFLMAVAQSLGSITVTVPPREGMSNFPKKYLEKLISVNKTIPKTVVSVQSNLDCVFSVDFDKRYSLKKNGIKEFEVDKGEHYFNASSTIGNLKWNKIIRTLDKKRIEVKISFQQDVANKGNSDTKPIFKALESVNDELEKMSKSIQSKSNKKKYMKPECPICGSRDHNCWDCPHRKGSCAE